MKIGDKYRVLLIVPCPKCGVGLPLFDKELEGLGFSEHLAKHNEDALISGKVEKVFLLGDRPRFGWHRLVPE